MIGCMVPGCPCRHTGLPDRAADPEEVATVLARRMEPGAGVDLRHRDKIGAAVALTQLGFSARKIGAVLGVTDRTVCRWRAATRLTEETA